MVGKIAITGLAAMLAATAGQACDLEGEGWDSFLAYVDYSGMNEQQALEAEKRAVDEYHAKQMVVAKAAFVSRFNIKVEEQPTQVAQSK